MSTPSRTIPEPTTPTISTPSAGFWISNASQEHNNSVQGEIKTNPVNRNLFSKLTRIDTSKKNYKIFAKKLAIKRATISRLKYQQPKYLLYPLWRKETRNIIFHIRGKRG